MIQSKPSEKGEIITYLSRMGDVLHNVLDRYGQIIAAVVGGVDAVGDGNEAHPVGREYPAQIPASFDVLAPQPGEVFYDDTVDVAIGDILHHFLERRAVKR